MEIDKAVICERLQLVVKSHWGCTTEVKATPSSWVTERLQMAAQFCKVADCCNGSGVVGDA